VAGIVITALGMKKALTQIADTGHYDLTDSLHGVVAWALPGGVGVFLLASAALLFRTTSHRSPLLLTGGAVCLVAGPALTFVPSLVALALLAALRSPRWAAIVLAPVAAATLLLFGALGWAGIPLGIATSMFAALNLGAGVDFAVQYVYAYRRERSVVAALATTGRGLRWNAVVLALGIAVLALSAVKPNASLGLLLAAAMLVSYGATLALLPALLSRWGR